MLELAAALTGSALLWSVFWLGAWWGRAMSDAERREYHRRGCDRENVS